MRYVLCVDNREYLGFGGQPPRGTFGCLQIGKVYRSLPSRKAEELGMISVIDEDNEAYLYPKSYFVPIEVPPAARRAIARATAPLPPPPARGRRKRPPPGRVELRIKGPAPKRARARRRLT